MKGGRERKGKGKGGEKRYEYNTGEEEGNKGKQRRN